MRAPRTPTPNIAAEEYIENALAWFHCRALVSGQSVRLWHFIRELISDSDSLNLPTTTICNWERDLLQWEFHMNNLLAMGNIVCFSFCSTHSYTYVTKIRYTQFVENSIMALAVKWEKRMKPHVFTWDPRVCENIHYRPSIIAFLTRHENSVSF